MWQSFFYAEAFIELLYIDCLDSFAMSSWYFTSNVYTGENFLLDLAAPLSLGFYLLVLLRVGFVLVYQYG